MFWREKYNFYNNYIIKISEYSNFKTKVVKNGGYKLFWLITSSKLYYIKNKNWII